MKLAQFNALCVREWAREPRGDVAGLSLGDASRAELAEDMILNPDGLQSPLPPGTLLNPVTRSAVRISHATGPDTVFVACGPGESRTLTLLPADARLTAETQA